MRKQGGYSELTKSGKGNKSLSVFYKNGTFTNKIGFYLGKPSIYKPIAYIKSLPLDTIKTIVVNETGQIVWDTASPLVDNTNNSKNNLPLKKGGDLPFGRRGK
jgi:hypothetical protein